MADDEDLWIRPATLNESRRMLLDPMRYSLVPAGNSATGLTGERRAQALADETIAMLMDPDTQPALAAAKSAQDDTCLFVVDEAWIKGDVDFIRSATPGKETFVTESPFGVTTIFVLTSEGPLLIVAGDPNDPEDGPLKIFSAMPLWNDKNKIFCWGVPALLPEEQPGMHHAYVLTLFATIKFRGLKPIGPPR
jgi:hypothetical protein